MRRDHKDARNKDHCQQPRNELARAKRSLRASCPECSSARKTRSVTTNLSHDVQVRFQNNRISLFLSNLNPGPVTVRALPSFSKTPSPPSPAAAVSPPQRLHMVKRPRRAPSLHTMISLGLRPKSAPPQPLLIGLQAYRLNLPKAYKVHPVFHVSLLEPHKPNTLEGRVEPPPPPVGVVTEEGEHVEYEVAEVLKTKRERGKLKYYVRPSTLYAHRESKC